MYYLITENEVTHWNKGYPLKELSYAHLCAKGNIVFRPFDPHLKHLLKKETPHLWQSVSTFFLQQLLRNGTHGNSILSPMHPLDSILHQGGHGVQPKFFLNAAPVGLNRFSAQIQPA